MAAIRIPDSTADLADVDASCRVDGMVPVYSALAGKFLGRLQELVYTQSVPASVWTIQHNLGRYPQVEVVDSAGNQWIPDVDHHDQNNLTVSFGAAFGGKAFLS